ncbi:MAG: MOSC N-terminal beta barrel domain-containing protein [Leeuwenhoekiella sp.]
MKIEQLSYYPLKSGKGNSISNIGVSLTGFDNDRAFAIIDSENNVLTAREKPEILNITAIVEKEIIKLSVNSTEEIELNHVKIFDQKVVLSLFKKECHGLTCAHSVNDWLSAYLNEPCKLVKIDETRLRVSTKTEKPAPIFLTDSCPIHLVNIASLSDLNSRLKNPVKMNRFRPNIVISGINAYQEEEFKTLKIGDCFFKMATTTKRCTLITINPDTIQKDKDQQPLRELSTYKSDLSGVAFGIYLIPMNSGTINLDDEITVED